MTRIDLDSLVDFDPTEEQHSLSFKGQEFTLPPRMPAAFVVEVSRFAKESSSQIEAVKAGAVVALADALAACFGAEQWQNLLALQPSQEHLMALVNSISGLYTDMTVGESRGSPGSSQNIRERQKPTSNGSTSGTSVEPQVT